VAINPEYIRQMKNQEYRSWTVTLDASDTIFATNYFLGYYSGSTHASELMQRQRKVDLERKKLWHNYKTPFLDEIVIRDSNFGINIYFGGSIKQGQKRLPDYVKLLDLTSSHINLGGWSCLDFIVTYTTEHTTAKLITDRPVPLNEYVLGFIRLDSGTLSCKPLQEHLNVGNFRPDFVNDHILNGKVIVPSQPFGKLLRGGKLIALLSQSNELRDFFNQRYGRNVVVFYTMSLWGSTKSQSQYCQLDRYLKYIGNTESRHLLRMKNPHKNNLLTWLDNRGISRSMFQFSSSSKEDKQFKELVRFLRHCLDSNSKKDNFVKGLRTKFIEQMNVLENITEKKRVYISTYGLDNWDDNLVEREYVVKEENNLEHLFDYWKKKVFVKCDWGISRAAIKKDVPLKYELLNQEFKDPKFNSVR